MELLLQIYPTVSSYLPALITIAVVVVAVLPIDWFLLTRRASKKALIDAAREAGLEDPFVHILKLDDHSVSYRVAGFLTEVNAVAQRPPQFEAAGADESAPKTD